MSLYKKKKKIDILKRTQNQNILLNNKQSSLVIIKIENY